MAQKISILGIDIAKLVFHVVGTNLAKISGVIVIFGALEQSRSISRYYKVICPLNFIR